MEKFRVLFGAKLWNEEVAESSDKISGFDLSMRETNEYQEVGQVENRV